MEGMEAMTDKYEKLVVKNQQLEEEADILAEENERLKDLLRSHGIDPFSGITESNEKKKIRDEVFSIEDGDGKYPCLPNLRIENASGEMNSLSVSYGSREGGVLDVILCGGVDKTLRVFDLQGEPLKQLEFSAPILAIDTSGSLVSCSLMDGGHVLVDLSTPSAEPEIYRTHNKYVVGTGWSSDGKYLYTCSHDKSVALFNVVRTPEPHLELISQLRFNETPECACFVPTEHVLPQLVASNQITQAEADSLRLELPFLVVGLRGVPYLLYLSLQTLQSFRVSLNENDWDAHVSFVPLALSLSNHGKYLAVATDKDMHLILQTGTNRRIRILAGGHQCDGYGKPKIAWDPSDLYLFTNCQSDYLLHVYSLASGKEETTYRSQFRQHTGQIRDLRVCSMNRRLLTTSFDRSVIEWSPMN